MKVLREEDLLQHVVEIDGVGLVDLRDSATGLVFKGIDWVIVGGESGPGARSLEVDEVRIIVRQCRQAGVPVFVKQMGADVRDRNDVGFEADLEHFTDGPHAGQPTNQKGWPSSVRVEHSPNGYRDEYQGAPVRIRLANRKGDDQSEWPFGLRVREFPTVTA